jgi:DNA-binding CsgD family transcriptional regulator
MSLNHKIPRQYANRDEEQIHIESEASRIAKEQVSSGVWNLQIVILAYTISIATMIMAFRGVRIEIIAICAIVGLSVIWVWGRLRYKRLYKRLYQNEIRHLQELANTDVFITSEEMNNPVVEKTKVPHLVKSPLTLRQMEILSLIAEGNSNKQVGFRLNISEHTIKNQLGYIFRKLDVENRTQAVLVSIQNGWIQSEVDEYNLPYVVRTSGRTVYETKID